MTLFSYLKQKRSIITVYFFMSCLGCTVFTQQQQQQRWVNAYHTRLPRQSQVEKAIERGREVIILVCEQTQTWVALREKKVYKTYFDCHSAVKSVFTAVVVCTKCDICFNLLLITIHSCAKKLWTTYIHGCFVNFAPPTVLSLFVVETRLCCFLLMTSPSGQWTQP